MSSVDDLANRIAKIGVSAVLIGEVLRLLIEKGALREGEAVDRLERIAAGCMASSDAKSVAEQVGIIQAIRDYVAGELDRKPS